MPDQSLRGRGSIRNVPNRFEALHVAEDPDIEPPPPDEFDDPDAKPPPLPTRLFRDDSQSILSRNRSPDLSFDLSLNPYRGCEHGCAYCYARPYHEYLGFSPGLDFESKIMVKPEAPELLRRALSSPRYVPENLAMSGVTDCYQPVEAKLRITRRCLEVLREFRHPVAVVTKNRLVARDADLLGDLAAFEAAAVFLSITSLDPALARRLEPRASSPSGRLQAIGTLAAAGVPVGVSIAPVIPGLNDHEIPAILAAAADHGATFATYSVVRLPHAVKDIFADWLDAHAPGSKDKILGRIRDLRDGRLNDPDFGSRHTGTGIQADQIRTLFATAARRCGLDRGRRPELTTRHFRRVLPGQQELF